MKYIEITVKVDASHAEAAADILRAATDVKGVWIDLPFEQADLESDAIVRKDHGEGRVRAYVPETADGKRQVERVQRQVIEADLPATVSTWSIDEENWEALLQEYFHPEKFGERVVIVPSWCTYATKGHEVMVRLDPGMAFGTGQHETTRMCLEALERTVRPGATVLDVGCGSGILALAAAKLGAREVYAVDIDEDCARIARRNAEMNGVEARVHVRQGSLGASWPFDEPPAGRFDVVVANIVAGTIIELAGELAAALTPGGRLIASGIIGEREVEVVRALQEAGLRVTDVRSMGDWRCIEAVRA